MDSADFKTRFLPLHARLYRMAFRLLGSVEDAEDIVQEVYLRLWQKRHELPGMDNPEAYAVAILRNLCLDNLRRTQPERSGKPPEELPLADRDTASTRIERQEERSILQRLIGHLGEPQRTVLRMRDLGECSFEEIASALHLSEAHVRMLLSRARKKMKEEYLKQSSI